MARTYRQLRQAMSLAHRRWCWGQDCITAHTDKITEVLPDADESHQSPVFHCQAASPGVPYEIQIPQSPGRGYV